MEKIELLAPAGDLEKLKTAIDYGADAVYFGGEVFSLRAGAGNFSKEEMIEGIKLETVKFLFHVRVERPVEREKVAQETSASHGSDDNSLKKEPVRNDNRVGRNDLCTCGSGKKYKNCCGREA